MWCPTTTPTSRRMPMRRRMLPGTMPLSPQPPLLRPPISRPSRRRLPRCRKGAFACQGSSGPAASSPYSADQGGRTPSDIPTADDDSAAGPTDDANPDAEERPIVLSVDGPAPVDPYAVGKKLGFDSMPAPKRCRKGMIEPLGWPGVGDAGKSAASASAPLKGRDVEMGASSGLSVSAAAEEGGPLEPSRRFNAAPVVVADAARDASGETASAPALRPRFRSCPGGFARERRGAGRASRRFRVRRRFCAGGRSRAAESVRLACDAGGNRGAVRNVSRRLRVFRFRRAFRRKRFRSDGRGRHLRSVRRFVRQGARRAVRPRRPRCLPVWVLPDFPSDDRRSSAAARRRSVVW